VLISGESKQKLGYRLVKNTKLLLPWEVTDGLKTKILGRRIYYFDSIDSTQNFAQKIATDPKENGTVIIAQKQTKGRGRLGRRWVSPSGGIWLSVILRPDFDISLVTLFPIASSLALARAIEKTLKIKTELKWPNDVTLKGKKIAGMLIDASIESNKISNLILGVGINFNIETKKLERTIKKSENYYGVATLTNKDENASSVHLVQSFILELEKIFETLKAKDVNIVIQEWTKRSSTIGKKITILLEGRKIGGKAMKLDKDGALLLKENKKTHRILVGDVSNLGQTNV